MKRFLLTMLMSLASVDCGGGGGKSSADGGVKGDTSMPRQPDESSYVPLDGVKVGTCGATHAADQYVDRFGVMDCNEPHLMELAGRYQIKDSGAYPGNPDIVRAAYQGCQPIFADYVGKSLWESEYDIRTITPSPATWAQGDREVICFVTGAARGPITQAARGSKR